MKRSEILSSYRIDKLDENTVFIQNSHFNFSYTVADSIVRDEFKGKYEYIGGLQCNYEKGSENYKNLEKWLIEICRKLLTNKSE